MIALAVWAALVVYLAGSCVSWFCPLWFAGDLRSWRAHWWRDVVSSLEHDDPSTMRGIRDLSDMSQNVLAAFMRAVVAFAWPWFLLSCVRSFAAHRFRGGDP